MRLCIFEDQCASQFEPLTMTRPVFDLRCGITSLAEKQIRYFAENDIGVLVRPHLSDWYQSQHPQIRVNDFPWLKSDEIIFVNGRWLPPLGKFPLAEGKHVGIIGEEVAYAIIGKKQWTDCLPECMSDCAQNWMSTLPHRAAQGKILHYPWDLVENNGEQLRQDFSVCYGNQKGPVPERVALIGKKDQLFISSKAQVDPMVVIDCRSGPVVIENGAVITAFSRIEGPCFIGPQTQIMGAKIRANSTFGPQCRIGGEVESSIIHGHSNKYHEGFLGHSYVGEWVNLAAGTHNSDLRNDYGEVSVLIHQIPVKTGLSKVGCFIGDHTKTGLGTLINTGANIGIFSNLISNGMYAPKYIPPFSIWMKGNLQESSEIAQVLITAQRVMKRRNCELTDAHAALYRRLFEETFFLRRRVLQEMEKRQIASRSA